MRTTRKIAVIIATVALAMAGAVGISAASNTGGCGGFPDVAQDSQFCQDITWMVDNGIAEGYDDGEYKPTQGTSRQAMSAFMHRFAATVTDGQNGATGARGPAGADGVSGRFVTNHTVSVPAGETATYARSCNDSSSHPEGGVAVGGGFTFNEDTAGTPQLTAVGSAPTANADEWATTVHNRDTTKARAYLSWAVCVAVS